MRKSLKAILVLTLVLLLAAASAGCTGGTPSSAAPSSSGSSGTSSASTPAENNGEKIQMVFSTLTGGANEDYCTLYTEVVEEFNANNEYNVEFVVDAYVNEQYKTKIATQMASNAQGDVFFTWEAGFLKPYVQAGKVYPIGDAIDGDQEWKDRFSDTSIFGPLTYDGKIYGVPQTKQGDVMSYNTAMFAEVGAEVPTTWDEFLEVCEKLKNGGYEPLAIPCGEAWYAGQFHQQLANGIGGEALYNAIYVDETTTWEDPAFIEAGERLAELAEKGYLCTNYLGMSPTEAFEAVANGNKIAMMYHITSGINKIKGGTAEDDIDMFLLPCNDPANKGVHVGSIGNVYCVSASAKNIEAACALVKEFSGEYVQTELQTRLGQVVVTDTEIDESQLNRLDKKGRDLLSEVTVYTPWFDRLFTGGEGPEFNNASVSILGGEDPATVMADLQQYVEDNATR
jgi:raffinose/stachyose/melibiose transport system substrate-binding protein